MHMVEVTTVYDNESVQKMKNGEITSDDVIFMKTFQRLMVTLRIQPLNTEKC